MLSQTTFWSKMSGLASFQLSFCLLGSAPWLLPFVRAVDSCCFCLMLRLHLALSLRIALVSRGDMQAAVRGFYTAAKGDAKAEPLQCMSRMLLPERGGGMLTLPHGQHWSPGGFGYLIDPSHTSPSHIFLHALMTLFGVCVQAVSW